MAGAIFVHGWTYRVRPVKREGMDMYEAVVCDPLGIIVAAATRWSEQAAVTWARQEIVRQRRGGDT